MKRSLSLLGTVTVLIGCSVGDSSSAQGCSFEPVDPCESDAPTEFFTKREGETVVLEDGNARLVANSHIGFQVLAQSGAATESVRIEGPFQLLTEAPPFVESTGPGDGALILTDECQREIRLELHASPPARSEVLPVGDLGLQPIPSELWPNGLGVLPDGVLLARARFYDAEGERQDGFGAEQWAVDNGRLDSTAGSPLGTDVASVRSGGTLGTANLQAAGGGSLPFAFLPSGSIDRLGLVDEHVTSAQGRADPIGPELSLAKDGLILLRVLAYDAEGRLLFGDDGQPTSATLAGGAPLPSDPTEGVPLYGDTQATPGVVWIAGAMPGDARLTIRRGGKSTELLVHVTEAAPQPTSP